MELREILKYVRLTNFLIIKTIIVDRLEKQFPVVVFPKIWIHKNKQEEMIVNNILY